ncbi:hypothetical protein BAZSYMA_ACONTIG41858_0 [Bathymodiolus azoricus thioautotrophic gill symbiont]|uniref:Uncharacterized protein n=1 Tax=Bathymodiolus azoricus thioautotrophic gill symbiont TaxID=235205 RepID=A0A1H6M842_9GAMM|nr:hypothetical protein BAZSYMA_ACONTIG41858_0 [Bathymodiolus azoricus thioautotrophic gill symbiont]
MATQCLGITISNNIFVFTVYCKKNYHMYTIISILQFKKS